MTKTIIVTGASSGLGAAIAEMQAIPGVTIYLIARNKERLEAIANICRTKGAVTISYVADVSSLDEMTRFYEMIEHTRIDEIYACAAISMDANEVEQAQQAKKIFDINVVGISNTVLPAAEMMFLNQSPCKIVIIGSLAGELAFPTSPSYSASKAAVKTFADSLRIGLKKYNIRVITVLPGFISTPMTNSNQYKMPLIISAHRAAEIIISGVNSNREFIVFPKIFYYLIQIVKLLPRTISDYLLSLAPSKEK